MKYLLGSIQFLAGFACKKKGPLSAGLFYGINF